MITDAGMERAIRLWTGRHSGTWRESDETELQAWLAAGAGNRSAYEKVARAWSMAGGLTRAADESRPLASAVPGRRLSSRSRVVLGACAALLLVAMAVPVWQLGVRWWNGAEIQLSTSKGAPRSFVLNDGTKVLLDADSVATASVGAHARRLNLKRGEALIAVVHDAWRPFDVVTAAGRVKDLGTQFDVETLGGVTRVSVLQGHVRVLTAHGEALLGAGQAGGYDSNGTLLMPRSLDPAATRWSAGQRHFDDERLGDVLARLGRYHPVAFMFSDERLQDLRVSGTFKIADLGLFLRTLSAALPIEAHSVDPQHVQIAPRAQGPGPDSRFNQRTNERR